MSLTDWTTNPAHYVARYRRISRIPIWEIRLCIDQIQQFSRDIGDLISAYSWLLHRLQKIHQNPLCLTPVHPENFQSIVGSEGGWRTHVQLLHSKLVGLKLVEKRVELEGEYREVWELHAECRSNSFLRPIGMSDEELDSAVGVVREWVEVGPGGKAADVKGLIREANDYVVVGDKRLILDL